jgi:ABC-2 type transport system permease protein
MFPIAMPIIFSYVITNVVNQNPNTPMAFWASMIPFSSSDGNDGENCLWCSLHSTLLGSSFKYAYFNCWIYFYHLRFKVKVYRTGILLYGKKVTWKECLNGLL